MNKYNNFNFEKYTFDIENLEATFYYNFDEELFFEEKISFFDESFKIRKNLDIKIINNILFHIHLALWISYYKFYPTKNLILKTWKIDDLQADFWHKFYLNWLGEFFYRNNLDPNWLINFLSESDKNFSKIDFDLSEKYLLAVWWWKDSIVSIELLKKIWKEIDLITFAVNDNILYENTAINSGLKRVFIKRYINDYKKLIEEWYFNWHVPITWMIAFVLELVCYLYDYKYVVLSNEKSANFENTIWKWVKINHQWSKSLEFEKDFWSYVEKYISSSTKYFSLLRPFYELKIAEIFSKVWEKYFTSFSSCNTNFKIFKKDLDIKNLEKKYWCNSCPKCVFVYIILRAYLNKNQILSIFWRELYEDKSLEKLFRELAWISWIKPFECVWTNEEVVLAMKLAYDNWQWKLPFILDIFSHEINSKMSDKDFELLKQKTLIPNYDNNLIPNDLINQLKLCINTIK